MMPWIALFLLSSAGAARLPGLSVCEIMLDLARGAEAPVDAQSLAAAAHLINQVHRPKVLSDEPAEADVNTNLGLITSWKPDGLTEHSVAAARLRELTQDLSRPGVMLATAEVPGRAAIARVLDVARRQAREVQRRSPEPWLPAASFLASILDYNLDKHLDEIERALAAVGPQFAMMGGTVLVTPEQFRRLTGRYATEKRPLRFDSVYLGGAQPTWMIFVRVPRLTPALASAGQTRRADHHPTN